MFIMSILTILPHWIIPILLIVVLFFILKKKKKMFKALCIVIVALTVFSYFSVGMYSKSTVNGTVTASDLSKLSKDQRTYFCKDFEGGSSIYGTMNIYNKKEFDVNSCVNGFGNEVSSINKKIMKNEKFFSKETNEGITVKYSPVVLSSEPGIIFTRDRYFGFIIIEQNNSIIFIKYKMNVEDPSIAFDFFGIYKKNIKISVKDIFSSVMSEKEYNEQLYY